MRRFLLLTVTLISLVFIASPAFADSAPNAPSNLSAAAVDDTTIDLTWTDGSTDETEFQIERMDDWSNGWALVGTALADATTFRDYDLPCGQTEHYRVRAHNASGDSAYTAEASATTDVCIYAHVIFSPPNINFFVVHVGAASPTYTITVTNVSHIELDIVKLAPPEGFVVTDGCDGAKLMFNQSCSFDLTFAPVSPGDKSGFVDLQTNVPYYSVFYVMGWATSHSGAGAEPDSINFGHIQVGGSSEIRQFSVQNISQTLMTVGEVTQSGSGTFAMDNGCFAGVQVLPEMVCAVNVIFTPTAAGVETGSISIQTDVQSEPIIITLKGTGTSGPPSPYALSRTSYDFGSVLVGQTSAPATFTMTNTGSADLWIDEAYPTAGFAVSHNDCEQKYLHIDATCSFNVTFEPASPGSKSGKVRIPTYFDSAYLTLTGLGATPSAPPKLTSPKNGLLEYKQAVKLSWGSVKGAKAYHVEVGTDSGFVNPLAQFANPSTATFTTRKLPFGVYFWHVATKDASGQGVYSAPWRFEVTLNKTPAKNAALKNGQVKFAWQAVAGKSYLLEYSSDPAFPAGPLSTRVSMGKKTTYTIPKNLALAGGNRTYYWHVSIDSGATWTPYWTFKVK